MLESSSASEMTHDVLQARLHLRPIRCHAGNCRCLSRSGRPNRRPKRTAHARPVRPDWSRQNPPVTRDRSSHGSASAKWTTQGCSDERSDFTACRGGGRDSTATLRKEYENVDLLVIDDAQDLRDRPAAQVEVGRLMQTWIDGGARIVAASSAPPTELPALTAAFRSNVACQWVALKHGAEGEGHRLATALLARQSLSVSGRLVRRLVRDSGGDVRRLIGAASIFRREPRTGRLVHSGARSVPRG